ncbi:small GTP-binding protein domain-containing protein [Legionella quinlivanii DSM 21216]|uniref:Rab family GTPase n=1 Tax=Legionella quinlivanii TaxID=45073 RepID=UPI00089F69ED|nr:Rab family GTPase [Legionella quinlivanii]SEG40503.1 small GTP-binding protein domain-containing protein [Legionella quinlivanii DSM 21216]
MPGSTNESFSSKKVECKVLILGAPKVGKTSLIYQFSDGVFPESDDLKLYLSHKIRTVKIAREKVEFKIYDEEWLGKLYSPDPMNIARSIAVKSADVLLVLFDKTNRSSFEKAKETIEYLQKEYKDRIMLLLVGTKSDLTHQCAVDNQEANLFAEQIGLEYIETSSKEGTNVDMTFAHLGKNLLTPTGERTRFELLSSGKIALLKERLEAYISRIESYNNGNRINFETGFWFFSKSRAANREANYLLAKKMLEQLNQGYTLKSLYNPDILIEERNRIISENHIFERDGYVKRDINSSQLNEVISLMNKP